MRYLSEIIRVNKRGNHERLHLPALFCNVTRPTEFIRGNFKVSSSSCYWLIVLNTLTRGVFLKIFILTHETRVFVISRTDKCFCFVRFVEDLCKCSQNDLEYEIRKFYIMKSEGFTQWNQKVFNNKIRKFYTNQTVLFIFQNRYQTRRNRYHFIIIAFFLIDFQYVLLVVDCLSWLFCNVFHIVSPPFSTIKIRLIHIFSMLLFFVIIPTSCDSTITYLCSF